MHYTALLVVVALLVSVSAALAVPDSTTTSKIPRRFRQVKTISSSFLNPQSKVSEERAWVSVSSVEKIKNLFTPSKVSEETLQRWLKKGNSADNVFVRLHLTSAKDNLFENPQFVTWLKYVDELNAKGPKSGESIISTLTSHYGNQALSQMIIAAQKIPRTKTLATEVQTRQLKYWLDDKKTPAEVYKLLMLDKAEDKLIESPQLVTWLSYVDDFNVKTPRKSQSRISILTKYYEDATLSKMLLKAEDQTPKTMDLATKLQAEQIQHWLAMQTSPSDVFTFLMLNKAGDKLFENSQFPSWINLGIEKYYNNEEVAKMLEAAKQVPGSKKIVKRLGTEQNWLTRDTPDELFKRLKLDKGGDDLLNSPELKTWTKYMKDYNKDNPKYQTTLIATLAKHYGDGELVQMINAAKNVKSTANVAKRLEAEQFQLWLKNHWTPDDIFKLMNLDETGDKLLSSPYFTTWTKYLGFFNMENPAKKTTLLTTLTQNHYSEKRVVQLLAGAKTVPSTESIAAKLHAELFQHWLAVKRSPTSVFSMLNLNREGEKLLTTPQFRAWLQYSDNFSMKVPDEEVATSSLMATLTEYYKVNALAKMVETAMKDPSTKNIAKRVESELIKK